VHIISQGDTSFGVSDRGDRGRLSQFLFRGF